MVRMAQWSMVSDRGDIHPVNRPARAEISCPREPEGGPVDTARSGAAASSQLEVESNQRNDDPDGYDRTGNRTQK